MNRVVLSCHRNNTSWSFQTFSDRLCNRRFAYSRRTCEQKHESFLWVYSLVLCNKLKNSLLSFWHAIMRFLENWFGKCNIPIRLNSLIPWKSEYVIEIGNFLWVIIFWFRFKSINLLLNYFSNWFRHVDNLSKLFSEVIFLGFLILAYYFLQSTFNNMFLWSFFKLFSCWSNDHDFHLNQLIELLEIVNNLLSSKNRICHFEKFFLFLNELLNVGHKTKSIEHFKVISSHSKCVLIQSLVDWLHMNLLKDWELKLTHNVLVQVLSWVGN